MRIFTHINMPFYTKNSASREGCRSGKCIGEGWRKMGKAPEKGEGVWRKKTWVRENKGQFRQGEFSGTRVKQRGEEKA